MNRLFLLMLLLAIAAVTFVPAFDAVVSHHADSALPHAAEDDDCGCVCHVDVHAVVIESSMELHLAVSAANWVYRLHQTDPLPTSLDRPPELFS